MRKNQAALRRFLPYLAVTALSFTEVMLGQGYESISAKYETKRIRQLPDGSEAEYRIMWTFLRDREGRVRNENEDVIIVQDPVAGKAFVFNKQMRTYRVQGDLPSSPRGATESLTQEELQVPKAKHQVPRKLGEKTIAGLVCEGREFDYATPGDSKSTRVEVWFSRPAKLPVSTLITGPSGTVEHVVKEVTIGADVPLSAFQVPDGFKPQ